MKEQFKPIQTLISLVILILLLLLAGLPTYAGETVLNTSLSVIVPDRQSGNPGDFLTYVLSFQNRSNSPIDLQIEYLTDSNWNVIGETMVTIPANTNSFYFPVTVIVPPKAQAQTDKGIGVRFKIHGAAFYLPMVSIPIRVNPVSTINFTTPPPQSGLNGTTVEYQVVVANTGNTTEHFSVKGVSENDWPITIEPTVFLLNPGESHTITIKHQIPGYSETDYDQVKLEFFWGDQHQMILLTTNITDQFAKMADRYYIWQGQVSASHPNIAEPGLTDPNLSFAINGQWNPDSSYQLYFSDLLSNVNRRYFTHYQTDSWDVKAGDFSLPWEGIVTPQSYLGNLRAAHNDGDRSYRFYAWEHLPGDSSQQPFGLEALLDEHSRLSLLRDYHNDSEQTVFEWDYQTNLKSGLKWSNSLAFNASDSQGYALGIGLERYYGNWYFTSKAQAFKEISDSLDKKLLQFTLYQPLSDEKMTIYHQFSYEAKTLADLSLEQTPIVTDYDNYYLQTIFNWPSGFNIRFSYQYQLADGSFAKDNTSFFMEDSFEIGRYQHQWWLNHSADRSANDPDSNYTKVNWETEYALGQTVDLLFNSQFVANSAAVENESKLGLGLKQRLYHNSLEWKALWYRHFNFETEHSWEFSLDWRIYQYQLALQYLGAQHSPSDTINLTIRRKFSVPVPKPLGTVEGVAFLDRNHNGIFDQGEPPLRKMRLILDGSTTFETDSTGGFAIYGLTPGEHQISLDPLYEVIYLPRTPVTTISVKPYQTVRLELPLVRSQNITGTIYLDRNRNGKQEPDEPYLPGIPIILSSIDQATESLVYSNHDGQFIFYQLAPGSYRINFNEALLPDNLQAAKDMAPIIIDSSNFEEASLITIGLIPYERPINLVKEESKLLLELKQELIKPGAILDLIIESSLTLSSLELLLPNGETIQLEPSSNLIWNYHWQIPLDISTGQVKLKCTGMDLEGKQHQAEALLVIIP